MTTTREQILAAREEIWKPIPGYHGYWASSLGRVKNAHSLLCPKKRNDGYIRTSVVKDGKRQGVSLHRLVCLAFHGLPKAEPRQAAAHLNGIRDDNRPENLKWCSYQENSGHQKIHGTCPMGEKHVNSKLTSKQVAAIRLIYKELPKLKKHLLCQLFDVSDHTIKDAAKGKSYVILDAALEPQTHCCCGECNIFRGDAVARKDTGSADCLARQKTQATMEISLGQMSEREKAARITALIQAAERCADAERLAYDIDGGGRPISWRDKCVSAEDEWNVCEKENAMLRGQLVGKQLVINQLEAEIGRLKSETDAQDTTIRIHHQEVDEQRVVIERLKSERDELIEDLRDVRGGANLAPKGEK